MQIEQLRQDREGECADQNRADLEFLRLQVMHEMAAPREQVETDNAGNDEKQRNLAAQHGKLDESRGFANRDQSGQPCQQQKTKNIIEHCRRDDRLTDWGVELSEVHEDPNRGWDGGNCQRCPDENTLGSAQVAVGQKQPSQRDTEPQGKYHATDGDHKCPARML